MSKYREAPFVRVAYQNIGDPEYYQRLLTRELEISLRREKGVYDLTQRVARVAQVSQSRAATIAQTERTRAQNMARWDSLLEANRTERAHKKKYRKQWVSHQDGKTRDSHASLSGQVQYVNDPFVTMDGTKIMYPGDPSAPASETINCRCYMRRINPK